MKNLAAALGEDIRILVHQNGFVLVGHYNECNGEIHLSPYAFVRRWGTSKGMPQLAQEGPLTETILDKGNTVFRCKIGTELFTLECSSKWAGIL